MQIKKNIPNAITSLNLVSGCVGIMLVLRGSVELGSILVIVAAVFDFFDGMAARLLHVHSEIGKELDSLADLVSFGVLPGALVFVMLEQSKAPNWVVYFALLIPVLSAIRLAKFNLDTRQTESFLGLPVPANAIFWVGVTYINTQVVASGFNVFLQSIFNQPLIIIILTVVFSLLLVSELPLFSLKFKNLKWANNQTRLIFIGLALLLFLVFRVSSLPMIIVLYIIISIFVNMRAFKNAN
jgi:CDP-diacylglycerol--serine O-phosphatidyltransferase